MIKYLSKHYNKTFLSPIILVPHSSFQVQMNKQRLNVVAKNAVDNIVLERGTNFSNTLKVTVKMQWQTEAIAYL